MENVFWIFSLLVFTFFVQHSIESKTPETTCPLIADTTAKDQYNHVMLIDFATYVSNAYRRSIDMDSHRELVQTVTKDRICNHLLRIGQVLHAKLFGTHVMCKDSGLLTEPDGRTSTLTVYIPLISPPKSFHGACKEQWQSYFAQLLSQHVAYAFDKDRKNPKITVRGELHQLKSVRARFDLQLNAHALTEGNPEDHIRISHYLVIRWLKDMQKINSVLQIDVKPVQGVNRNRYEAKLLLDVTGQENSAVIADLETKFEDYFRSMNKEYRLWHLEIDDTVESVLTNADPIAEMFSVFQIHRPIDVTQMERKVQEVEMKSMDAIRVIVNVPMDSRDVPSNFEQRKVLKQRVASMLHGIETIDGLTYESFEMDVLNDETAHDATCRVTVYFSKDEGNATELKLNKTKEYLRNTLVLSPRRRGDSRTIHLTATPTSCLMVNIPQTYLDWYIHIQLEGTLDTIEQLVNQSANLFFRLLKSNDLIDYMIGNEVKHLDRWNNQNRFTVHYVLDIIRAIQDQKADAQQILDQLDDVISKLNDSFTASRTKIKIYAEYSYSLKETVCLDP